MTHPVIFNIKYILLLAIATQFLGSCTKTTEIKNPLSITLDANWQFKQADKDEWMPATVPGVVHTDLMDNGIIEDPYYRINERDMQWIDKKDWEYRCDFDLAEEILEKDKVELVFHGLDTYAEVYLNDELILKADNMFRTWEVDCKDHIVSGKNRMRILFLSPTQVGLEKLEANGYPLPASNDQSENGEMGDKKVSIFTRKAGYHYGWDWGPRLVTSGIWRPVELKAWNNTRIKDIHVEQLTLSAQQANIRASVEIEAYANCTAHLTVEIGGENMKSKTFDIRQGGNVLMFDFEMENPKRWWPNGLGDPNMYTLSVKAEISQSNGEKETEKKEVQFGLRNVRLVQEPDEAGDGKSFYFEVNGIPVFAKGANYIPNDVFLTRVSPEDYERIIKDAADANMNMLRVWGGGIYENDIFYDLCDKYGIMVWQDFMFACSMYPGDDEFLENVRLEAKENIMRLRNHPSLVLWCGNNEIEVAWGEYEEGRGWGWKGRYTDEQRKEIWKDYDTLFHHILPQAVQQSGAGVPYWHSSPSAGMGELAGYENNKGDMHYWGVWHGQHPFRDFRKYRARFMSEYGFQSFPELNTVAAYALPEEWDIESEVMAAHQRSGIGNLRIKQYMEDDYVIPDDFEQFLYVSHLLQAEGIKMAIKSHRTEMPYCMGSLYWQLNDCWPVASWSGIDYYGRWKAMHYFVKEAYKETILAAFQEDDSLSVWIVSDRLKETPGRLHLQLIDFEGKEYWSETLDIQIPQNKSEHVFKKDIRFFSQLVDKKSSCLSIELFAGEELLASEIHYFVQPKELSLQDPRLEISIKELTDRFVIELECASLAKNVFLSTDLSNKHFTANYFDVIPGKTTHIAYPKVDDLDTFRSRLKVLTLNETIPSGSN